MKRTWLASCFAAAVACFSSVTFGDAGLPRCETSDTCAAPTPYCHPERRDCVECLSSRNCPNGRTCEETSGTCVGCSTDGECSHDTPYCAEQRCVECRTDSNCSQPGVSCTAGICGTCGDGVCSRRERLIDQGGFWPGKAAPYEICVEDCKPLLQCNAAQLETSLILEVGDRNLVEGICNSRGAPDAMLDFTAREAATYYVTIERLDGASRFHMGLLAGKCPGDFMTECNQIDTATLQQEYSLDQGEALTLVLESAVPARFRVTVSRKSFPCEGESCPSPGDGGRPNDQGKTDCLVSARSRGEEICSGVTCACSHCPRDYDQCAVIPGCDRVSECLRTRDCVSEECYTSGDCARVIDAYGGPQGPAFRTASALQSCSLAFSCALPCGDAGTSPEPDAGVPPICAAGSERACSCEDGGSGEQLCNDGGSAYGECRCRPGETPTEPRPKGSSCDCNLARGAGGSAGTAALLALAAAVIGRRTRRAGRGSR